MNSSLIIIVAIALAIILGYCTKIDRKSVV